MTERSPVLAPSGGAWYDVASAGHPEAEPGRRPRHGWDTPARAPVDGARARHETPGWAAAVTYDNGRLYGSETPRTPEGLPLANGQRLSYSNALFSPADRTGAASVTSMLSAEGSITPGWWRVGAGESGGTGSGPAPPLALPLRTD